MATQRQIYLQKALPSLAVLMILLSTVVQSQSQDLSEPTVTALYTNGSVEEPRVLSMHRPCEEKDAGFCDHGKCMYPQDRDEPACICEPSYTGDRCMFFGHVNNGRIDVEGMIGVIVGAAFVIICILAVALYCCLRGRCKRAIPPYKAYGSEDSV